MFDTAIILIFCLGYAVIAFEEVFKINKAAVALISGTLCWTFYILGSAEKHLVLEQLSEHLGDISGILFFLLGAMVIVELIDAHDGFQIITDRIRSSSIRRLLIVGSLITFLLSAVLDNLTTTIVMVSLIRKIIYDREQRLIFAGMIVLAANAGGAWSPIGDVTSTMLWIGGQITALHIVRELFLPSLVCLLVPLLITALKLRGTIDRAHSENSERINSTPFERNAVFSLGIGTLLMIPVFKTVTHLPPVIGMLLGLGLLWVITELIHQGKGEAEKGLLSVNHAIRKIDTPSILFFLGILLCVGVLQSNGALAGLAHWLDQKIGDLTVIALIVGVVSAVVDNVPLMAAAQGMYSLADYPVDHFLWIFLAYCTGTGGSALIIGSAAGVAAMGLEKIDFLWYLKKFSLLALIGYISGAATFLLMRAW